MKRRKQGLIQTIVQMYVYKQGVYPFRVQVDVPIYSFTDGRPPRGGTSPIPRPYPITKCD